MKKIEAHGHIDQDLKLYNSDVFKQSIRDIGFASDCRLTLEYGKKRSLDQNSYLWGAVINSITVRVNQEGWDYSPDEMYVWLQSKFCKCEKVNEETGAIKDIVKPFKTLSTDEFDKIVMQELRNWAHEKLGVYIKTPPEFYEMREDLYEAWRKNEITKEQAIKLSKTEPIHE